MTAKRIEWRKMPKYEDYGDGPLGALYCAAKDRLGAIRSGDLVLGAECRLPALVIGSYDL